MLNHIPSSAPAPNISCDMFVWCLPLHALYIIKIQPCLANIVTTDHSELDPLYAFVLGSTQSTRSPSRCQDKEWVSTFITDIASHPSIRSFLAGVTDHWLTSLGSHTHGFDLVFRHCTQSVVSAELGQDTY